MRPDRPRTSPRAPAPLATAVATPARPLQAADRADLRREVAAAWSTLLPSADAIADGITLTLFERDRAVYDRAGPDLPAEIRDSTRRHIRRGLESMAGRPGASHRAAELWRETGRERARQRVPMELVLNAYTLGTRVLWEALVARQQAGDLRVDQRVLVAAGQSIWASLDVQNALMVESYRRESARLERRDLQRQQTMLDAVVEGRAADPDFAAEARDVLGLAPGGDVACVVALYDGSLDEPFSPPEDRLERLGLSSFWHVRAGVHYGLLAGWPLPADAALVELLGPGAKGRAAVATAPEGLAGVPTAYLLAVRAAETLAPGTRRLVAVADRIPEVLLAGNPHVVPMLLRESIEPLLVQPDVLARTLLDTLRALLRHDGSPTHAAEDLFCHRNTVIYRIRQIEQITGRSLSDPRDKLLLALGLMATGQRDPSA
jgi:hypothetical protein